MKNLNLVKSSRIKLLSMESFLFVGIGFFIRFLLLALSSGSNDILSWYEFARIIEQHGLAYTYDHVGLFNHPPLMGYYSLIIYKLASWSHSPFAILFKLPMVLTDVLIVFVLIRILVKKASPWMQRAIAGFSLSFIAILISAYHGNTDSLLAFFVLLSVHLVDIGSPFLGGLVLAGALNVKLIPLISVPLFIFFLKKESKIFKFCLGLILGLIPFVPILRCCTQSFYRNAILHNSNVENWGIDLFLLEGYKNPQLQKVVSSFANFYIPNGRFVIMIMIFILGFIQYKTRKWNIYELAVLGYSTFLIFTPGFGIQYLVLLAPLLFAVNTNWAILYSSTAGLFAGVIYYSFWLRQIPLHSQFYTTFPPSASLFGLVVWILLIFFMVCLLRKPHLNKGG